jgi:hypothetical protein
MVMLVCQGAVSTGNIACYTHRYQDKEYTSHSQGYLGEGPGMDMRQRVGKLSERAFTVPVERNR